MNRLGAERSPYLRQHAANPVDWYPWGEAAFAEARRRDVPVLLSVGYSACHWCHVMAHESFEDADTAAVLNRLFVNVKVDREERPDVDAVYMEAVQAQTGRGGWPMTAFLTPDGKPFFAGTYFPPQRRHGMPALLEVCAAVDDAWRNRRAELDAQAEELTAALGRDPTEGGAAATAGVVGLAGLAEAAERLIAQCDPQWGGVGGAPKFPQAMALEFLLRWVHRSGAGAGADRGVRGDGGGDGGAAGTARRWLDAMAAGGMYDHLGGGFARYSTDREWLVPHFEKMLYDNALLVRAYLHGWQCFAEPRYRQVVEDTVGYVLRDLARPGGGWAGAEDADSEGVEGKFYVWSPAELRSALGDDELAAEVASFYDVTDEGNFEGASILNRRRHRSDAPAPPRIDAARATLLRWRERRVRPGLDDKCLTEWNALFLSALAEAAGALGRADWLDAALANGEFLLRELRRTDGRWLRSWQDGVASPVLGYAADHAAVIDAFTRLAEASGQSRWLSAAVETADSLLALFWDERSGGFFTSGHDGERLIARPKELMDNAVPAADSMGALALRRLAALTGERRFDRAADAVLRRTATLAVAHPTAFGQLLVALELTDGMVGSGAAAPLTEVVVAGRRPELVAAVQRRWLPSAVLAWGEPYPSPLWEGREPGWAYVCVGAACRLPVSEVADVDAQLDAVEGSRRA
ncbi:MAG: thioredoxin domain-containing protein [Acidimicrobiales bacterium]|nr:thioredoxin domain-containing protein [Acidimicrobiales bacterium]